MSKKLVTLALISVCHFFDQLLNTQGSIRDLAIMFYILYESVQIVVTASSLGIPVPQMLVDLLETLKNKFKRKP